jgi:capsular polysaccharide biosynthesis protein
MQGLGGFATIPQVERQEGNPIDTQELVRILRRRWWVPALLLMITSVVSAAMQFQVNPTYLSSVRLVVSVVPEERQGPYYGYNDLYSWQASEYLTDDLGEILRSAAFAGDVERHLGRTLDYSVIQSGRPQKTHRILTFTIQVPDEASGRIIGDAVVKAIQEDTKKYVAELAVAGAQITVLDPPFVRLETSQTRWLLELAARLVLATVAGVGLALLLHLLDARLYTRAEVEAALSLPVLAAIPREQDKERPAMKAGVLRTAELVSRRRGEA